MPYEEYVRSRVLQLAGASHTRLGKTWLADAHTEEVKYYFPGLGVNAPLVPSVFAADGTVPANYGGYYLEAMDSHGGWVSSTVNLLRFMTSVNGRASRPDILSATLVAAMTSTGPALCAGGACHYSGGWAVRPTQGNATWWHGESLPGTTSLLVRSYHNCAWVALFNARAETGSLDGELDAALWNALAKSTSLPTHDLFATFRGLTSASPSTEWQPRPLRRRRSESSGFDGSRWYCTE